MKLIIDDMIEDNDNLLLTNKFITGFRLKLALTSDNIVIILPSKIDISLTNITIKEIKKINQNLYTLKETLEIFKNYQKELILDIPNLGNKTNLFIDLILVEIQKYRDLNFSFETNDDTIYQYLKATNYPSYLITNDNKDKVIIKRKDKNYFFNKVSSITNLYKLLNNHSNSFPLYIIIQENMKKSLLFNTSLLRLLEE